MSSASVGSSVIREDTVGAIRSVAILGAGHGGCAAAADLGSRGYAVRLHARNAVRLEPLRERGGFEARGVLEGFVPIPTLTTDVAEAIEGADLIMLVVPSVAHEHYAKALAPLLTPDRPVFLNPGHTGGGLHFSITRKAKCESLECRIPNGISARRMFRRSRSRGTTWCSAPGAPSSVRRESLPIV